MKLEMITEPRDGIFFVPESDFESVAIHRFLRLTEHAYVKDLIVRVGTFRTEGKISMVVTTEQHDCQDGG